MLTRVGVIVGAAALMASCGTSTMETATTSTSTTVSALPPPSIPPPLPTERQVFLVRSGPSDFYVEPVPINDGQTPADVTEAVRLAIMALLVFTGPDLESANLTTLPDLSSTVPPGTSLNSVTVDDGLVTVDLGGALVSSSGSSSEERLFSQQLAHTALLDPTLSAVSLLVDGRAIVELWGHLDWSLPLTADPAALSPVTIVEPLPTTTSSSSSITVIGWASVFEGTVLLRLEDPAGKVVAEGFATASQGAPGRGTWAWDVTAPGPGRWVIVASATDPSGGEGPPPFELRRAFDVSG